MLKKQLSNKSRNLQRNIVENLVKEEYFKRSIGLKTISRMKQEREKVLSEYQSCLRKFSWWKFAGLIWDKCSQIAYDTEVERRRKEGKERKKEKIIEIKKVIEEWEI